ncbi:hypothetical protein [Halomonas koreensis]|uniref:Uncharacterized protein n=1 Tax=Halomonas koreensis TaxID=245385 RepID=A0ABU1G2T2_9GAMM|nr:hypothetical protein [Halomonas koreensis]MDR5867257.1 hypothetical protein [Halomonas koreensis]
MIATTLLGLVCLGALAAGVLIYIAVVMGHQSDEWLRLGPIARAQLITAYALMVLGAGGALATLARALIQGGMLL